ncbi:MAG: HAD family hydrolase [Pseudomonadota bacterium]
MSNQQNWFANDLGQIPDRVMGELHAAGIERGKPLVAVDADEVLVHFAEHFGEYVSDRGLSFQLTEYRLDSALRDETGQPLSRDRIGPLVWGFIREQTRWQRMIEGAATALEDIARDAQIVVLTNAPAEMRQDRIDNLADHGIPYPVIMNEGGKGRALRWLAEAAAAPTIFVDDSVEQLGSAAKHAPQVMRLHLVGSTMLKPIIGQADTAQAHPHDWTEARKIIDTGLGNGI